MKKRTVKTRILITIVIITIIVFIFVACDDSTTSTGGKTACTHTYGEWTVETAPTCVATGTGTRTCSACGEADTNKTIPINSNNHNLVIKSATATCMEGGDATWECNRNGCDYEKVETGRPPLGHDFINYIETKAANCTEKGSEEATCERCTATDEKPILINDHHDWEMLSGTPSTCTVQGRGKQKCKLCNKEEDSDHLPLEPYNHVWGEYIQTTPPTCMMKGIKTQKCIECNSVNPIIQEGDDIDPFMHSWVNEVIVVTCAEDGYTKQTCSVCYNNPSAPVVTREITIDMWNMYHVGWSYNGALRINVNGTDLSENARLTSGYYSTYNFTVSSGDVVKIYWVTDNSYRDGYYNAFAVYYTDDPPTSVDPNYDDPNNYKMLVYRGFGYLDDFSGTLLGSFEMGVRVFDRIPSPGGHNWDWSTYIGGIRKCQRNGCSATAGIGDPGHAGGTIFYVNEEGFTVEGYTGTTGSFDTYTANYMEVFGYEGRTNWGASGTLIGTETKIGSGRRNTQIIVNYPVYTPAAQLCVNRSVTTEDGTVFNDWFLPSRDELMELYKSINFISIATNGSYWSSSEVSNFNAWYIELYYSPGGVYSQVKTNDYTFVCSIRAF